MEAKDNPTELSVSDIWDKGYKAGYDKRDSEFVYNPDYLDFQKGVKTGRELGIREVVEFINNRIIGVAGCTFEERLDGDKGCIELDMNENQWKDQQKDWGIE